MQAKELIQGLKIEQNLESIYAFLLQPKYILPTIQMFNFKKFLDHIIEKMQEYSKSNYHLVELFRHAKTQDLSDLNLFKLLGGADDGMIDSDEFKEAMTSSPQMYSFGSKLTQLEIRNLFSRMCCSQYDSEIS